MAHYSRFWVSGGKTVVTLGAVHLIVVLYYFFMTGDWKVLNLFSLVDMQLLVPDIANTIVSLVGSYGLFCIIWYVYWKRSR